MIEMTKRTPKIHKDSIHVEGAGKVTFSRGKNAYGARKDGKTQILKKKIREYPR